MISIGRYRFEGPFYDLDGLCPSAGVYAILDRQKGGFAVLDIGESQRINERIGHHERRPCWDQACVGMLAYACLYVPASTKHQRLAIEEELREQFVPACGVR